MTLATRLAASLAGLLASASPGVTSSTSDQPKPVKHTSPKVVTATPLDRRAVPEHWPVKAVMLSEDLFGADYAAPALLEAIVDAGADPWIIRNDPSADLAATLKTNGVPVAVAAKVATLEAPHGNIWLRDYGPVMVAEGTRSPRLRFADLRYDGAASSEDKFPAALAKAAAVARDEVPVLLDGGNFLASRDFCFTSRTDTALSTKDQDLKELATRVGCKNLVVVENPPHAHVDMWMKIVGDDTALINELDETSLGRIKELYGHVPPELGELRDNLDAKARELSKYLKVERLPMPMPYRGVFRTYTNALLVNGTAIVPSYSRFGWGYDDYPDTVLKERYEKAAEAAYAKHGYRARFVKADGLIFNGGAFHCVMLQVPKLEAGPTAPYLSKGY